MAHPDDDETEDQHDHDQPRPDATEPGTTPSVTSSPRRTGLRPASTRALPAVVVALALVLSPLPAQAEPVATPPSAATGEVPVVDPQAPTAAELEAQRSQAERLDDEVATQARLVAAARARLSELADSAGAALEAYQTSLLARDAAEAERRVQSERLAAARALVGEKQVDLGRWASSAYRDGGAMADYESLMTLLDAESTDELGQRLVMLQRVGRLRGVVVTTVKDSEAVQRDAARLAQSAAIRADLASERATDHKAEADRLVAEQLQQIEVLADLLSDTRGAAEQADQASEDLAAARAVAEQRRLAATADRGGVRGNAVTGEVGECRGGEVSRYPNGAIPTSALCPVASGHYLRADAAYALGQLGDAYAERWGSSLCLTDSYRTFDSQISLFGTKPGLAAVPGTSNHGWGTAVDLCGGIESFGSAPHQWMRDNAPLYGWFHPSWAQAGGSRPEPWHWEFGG
jgi:hypothetical protein